MDKKTIWAYSERLVSSMSFQELWDMAIDIIYNSKCEMDQAELANEIMEYCPDLLEDNQ